MQGRLAAASVILEIKGVDEAAREIERRMKTAMRGTIDHVTKGLERELEEVTRAVVPGKLWKAWTSGTWPKSGKLSDHPSGSVWVGGKPTSRSVGAIRFWSRPGRIVGRRGQFLAVPTPAAGPLGKDKNLTPAMWEAKHGAKLRFVPPGGRRKVGLLVLDEGVLSGKGRIGRPNTARRRAKGRGSATIIVFILVPAVAFANKFAIEPSIDRWSSRLGPELVARLGRIG